MTRKDELEARARDYVFLFVMSGAEPAATKNLTWMLQQVEREVLERASAYHTRWVSGKCREDYHATFEDWCDAQQKELG